jgi:hypothetical protein
MDSNATSIRCNRDPDSIFAAVADLLRLLQQYRHFYDIADQLPDVCSRLLCGQFPAVPGLPSLIHSEPLGPQRESTLVPRFRACPHFPRSVRGLNHEVASPPPDTQNLKHVHVITRINDAKQSRSAIRSRPRRFQLHQSLSASHRGSMPAFRFLPAAGPRLHRFRMLRTVQNWRQ